MQVKLSAPAENDLVDIALFIVQDSIARARSFLSELRKLCNSLGDFPEKHLL